jgi:hypothetical protein
MWSKRLEDLIALIDRVEGNGVLAAKARLRDLLDCTYDRMQKWLKGTNDPGSGMKNAITDVEKSYAAQAGGL